MRYRKIRYDLKIPRSYFYMNPIFFFIDFALCFAQISNNKL